MKQNLCITILFELTLQFGHVTAGTLFDWFQPQHMHAYICVGVENNNIIHDIHTAENTIAAKELKLLANLRYNTFLHCIMYILSSQT